MKAPYIIADVGSNWMRSSEKGENIFLATQHIDYAAQCGVSAVKFQFYTHEELYGIPGDDTYALPYDFLPHLAARCQSKKIDFLCTAFSEKGIGLVDPFVPMHKIASCEMRHVKLLDAALATEKALIISTGCQHTSELDIVRALVGPRLVYWLECVAAYPAKISDYNFKWLRGIETFGVSDHTIGNTLAIAATGFGATVFEKHFDALKIDEPLTDTPDSHFSMSPTELKSYCRDIRDACSIIRDRNKMTRPSEEPVKLSALRRLKITKPLKGGIDILEYGVNFGIFRSIEVDCRAAGPEKWANFEGKRVKRDMIPQEGLWFDDIE